MQIYDGEDKNIAAACWENHLERHRLKKETEKGNQHYERTLKGF